MISPLQSHFVHAKSLRTLSNMCAQILLGVKAEAKRDGAATSFTVGGKNMATMLGKLKDCIATG